MKTNYPIITSVGVAMSSALIMLLSMTMFSFLIIKGEAFQLLIYSTCPLLISALLFPFLVTKLIKLDTKYDNDNFMNALKSCIMFFLFLIPYSIIRGVYFENTMFMVALIVHYALLGVSEEYISRVVVLKILSEKYNGVLSIIISAFIFSFILHNNENFIVNLLVRTPLGIFFGYITRKTKCAYYTMSLHAIYDLILI